MLTFESGAARVTVDPATGGRLASLTVHGHELLVGAETDSMRWGSYPMVPFAGRIARGRFRFDGVDHSLPVNLAPHAIHGYGYTSAWRVLHEDRIAWGFGDPWPFRGEVVQRFDLADAGLEVTMTATAHERQPMMLGWHPWFRRDIGIGHAAQLEFSAAHMYELDAEGIPTGRLRSPSPQPWDDCFTDVVDGPRLRWGDELELRLSSTAEHWVVFTEPEHALCVEPQTGAPDEVNREPRVVEAGDTLSIGFRLEWD